MANPVWPVTLPTKAYVGRWNEVPERSFISFSVEVGPEKRRPRISDPGDLVAWEIPVLSASQRTDLRTFYKTTCKGGSLMFDMLHPIEATVQTFQFMDPPNIQLDDNNKFTASIQLRRIP